VESLLSHPTILKASTFASLHSLMPKACHSKLFLQARLQVLLMEFLDFLRRTPHILRMEPLLIKMAYLLQMEVNLLMVLLKMVLNQQMAATLGLHPKIINPVPEDNK
jgi:hypothetical protein